MVLPGCAVHFRTRARLASLSEHPPRGGRYIIVAGTQPGEGVVLSRNATAAAAADVDAFTIAGGYPEGSKRPWCEIFHPSHACPEHVLHPTVPLP